MAMTCIAVIRTIRTKAYESCLESGASCPLPLNTTWYQVYNTRLHYEVLLRPIVHAIFYLGPVPQANSAVRGQLIKIHHYRMVLWYMINHKNAPLG